MAQSSVKLIRQLLDDGIVRRLVAGIQLTDEPKLRDWHCEVQVGEDSVQRATGGGYGLSDGNARIKAVGEAVERLCSELIPADALHRECYRDLDSAVDPARFVNFSDAALGGDREGYIARLRDAKINWVAGACGATGKRVWLPAQLVYTTYDVPSEPVIRIPISTGAAFETSKEMAIQRGLFEIVERDSIMLWWLSGRRPPRLTLTAKRIEELIRYFDRYLLDVDLLDITSDLGVPSVLAVLRDRTSVGPAVSCGLKAASGYTQAAIGALVEAYQVRKYMRCTYLGETRNGTLSPEEITGIDSRGLFWYPQEMREEIEFFLSGDPAERRRGPAIGNLAGYLMQKGLDVYHVDLGTDQLRGYGCHVIRTIAPQMHPLFLGEDHRYDYSERLVRFHDGEPNRLPHPFL